MTVRTPGALLAAWMALVAPASAQVELREVLIGQTPGHNVPPLSDETLERALEAGRELFVAIDTPYEIWSGLGSYVHVVVYDRSMSPVAGANVYANGRPVGRTERSGTLVFRNVPRPENDEDDEDAEAAASEPGVSVVATARIDGRLWATRVHFETYARTPSFEGAHLFVYTDRGVYQPGDTISVRALAWRLRDDYAPLAETAVELHLLDADGRMIAGDRPTTTRWGTASTSFPLPRSMPEGRYQLVALFEGAREATDLRIERVQPPAIEIRHDLGRFITFDQSSLEFGVRISAFVGSAPKSGSLRVVVQRDGNTLHSEERRLDGSAAYRIAVPGEVLTALRQGAADRSRFTVSITATDEVGRSDTVHRDVTLARIPYTCIVETDKEAYTLGETAKVQVKLVDLDGVPVRNERVRLLAEPGPSPQPGRTDANGVALFDLRVEALEIGLTVLVDDVADPLATHALYAEEKKPMLSKVSLPLVKERASVPIEVVIEPGYVPTERVVHGDVVDSSGALVSAFLLPLEQRGRRWVARGRFEAPAWGTMLLTLFCAARDLEEGGGKASPRTVGLLTEGQQITVHPDRALTVRLGVPTRARPGERVTISGRVVDSRGRARAVSIGASVVDAAILSLLNPLEIEPGDRYYNPERKVMATTGAKILTWPVVSRTWGDEREDIALPPFGFRAGDPGWEPASAGGRSRRARTSGGAKGSAPVVGIGELLDEAPRPESVAPPARAADREDEHDVATHEEAAPEGPPEPLARITIRTRFDPVALWIAESESSDGRFRFEVELPDSITRQAVTVVASDETGGVGVGRASFPVTQPVFVRPDIPPFLRVGEEVRAGIAVRNLGSTSITARVVVASEQLQIEPTAGELEVEPGGIASLPVRIRAQAVGLATIRARVSTKGVEDEQAHTVRVEPAGVPFVSRVGGDVNRSAPFEWRWEASEYDGAAVSVTLPGAALALELAEELTVEPGAVFEAPGSRAALAYHVARYLGGYEALTAERWAPLRDAVARDLVLIGALRRSDGAQVYLRTGTASPYLTGRALEGLTAARALMFSVPAEVMAEAGGFILRSLDAQGLFNAADVAWWEGNQRSRRLALTAELFRILAEAGPDAVPFEMLGRFEQMRERVERSLNLSSDPLTLAQAGLGLLAYESNFMGSQLDARKARRLLRRVLEARREGHWEPSWFVAHGGTIAATAAALELAMFLDPATAAPLVREAMLHLRAARRHLGSWHDAAGVIAAARALAALPPVPAEGQAATVVVELNGVEMQRTRIDPKDPYASALPLARIDLSERLHPGENHLRVTYSGLQTGQVTVETRTFARELRTESPLRVARVLSKAQLRPGERTEVTISVVGEAQGEVVVEQPLPAFVAVDERALARAVEKGQLVAWHLGRSLRAVLPAGRERRLFEVELVGLVSGVGPLPPAAAHPRRQPARAVNSRDDLRLEVQ